MEEELLRRQMPHHPESEQAVVGAMLANREVISEVAEMLTGDDFYSQQCGAIFDAIVELYNQGQNADQVTVAAKLAEKGLPAEMASTESLIQLVNSVPLTKNAPSYAKVVKDKSLLRKIIKVSQEIENECFSATDDVEILLEETEKKVFKLTQNRTTDDDYVPIETVVTNAMARIAQAARQKGAVTGISTGFIDLDKQTAGLQPSDLILVAARPSMGKTAFVLNIADNIVCKQNKSAAIFSLEMSKEQLVNRMFSMESKVDAQKLRTGQLLEEEWERLIEGANNVANSKLVIDDTPGISINALRSKCRKYKAEFDIQIIMIDYLQLMTGSGRSESRQQEISEISRSLKALARELNVPVIALSQLSRAVEQRPDHRPMLSDLRESGAIEQDADVVMFIYRDDYYNKDTPNPGTSEIIVAKQRNGPVGTVELAWIANLTQFANKAHENIDSYRE